MDPVLLSLVGLVVFAGALFLKYMGNRDHQTISRIQALPLTAIDGAGAGNLRIRGKVHITDDGAVLTSPVSRRPCVAWRVVVEQRSMYRGRVQWRTVVEETRAVPFLIKDDTGVARIDPYGCLELARWDDTWEERQLFIDLPEELRTFIEGHRVSPVEGTIKLEGDFRFFEEFLEAGEIVSIVGTGEKNNEGYLRITAMDDGMLLVTKDAQVSAS